MNLVNFGFGQLLWETVNGLFLMICNMIYMLISLLFEVFMAVSKVNLFSEENFEKILGGIYTIMGIAMLFIFAYNIVLMIINPDGKESTGKTGKIVKETIISLTLVILLPTIFNWLYVFQTHLLDSNIIGKIVLSSASALPNDNPNCDYSSYKLSSYMVSQKWYWFNSTRDVTTELNNMCNKYNDPDPKKMNDSKRGAYTIAPTLLTAFYRPNHFTFDSCEEYVKGNSQELISNDGEQLSNEEKQICVNYFYDVNASKYSGNITPFVYDTHLKKTLSDSDSDILRFDWLLAVVAGAIAVYMFFAYTIEVGVRVAKLGVLQMFSPVAVMLRIVPKQKKIYDKWLKQLIDTYLDVFIRVAIIYFVLFAISLVPDVLDTLWTSLGDVDSNFFIKILASVFLILGILKFGKDAPALLKEFFNSGKFSVKNAMKGFDPLKSGIYGATTGKGLGRLGGFASGFGRGTIGDYNKAVKGLDTSRTERANGSSFGGRSLDRMRGTIGMESRAAAEERNRRRNVEDKFHTTERRKQNQELLKSIGTIKDTATKKIEAEDSKHTFGELRDANGNLFAKAGLNYAMHKKNIDILKKKAEKATNETDRENYLKQAQNYTRLLEDKKSKAINNALTDVFSDDPSIDKSCKGLFNSGDISTIQEEKRKIQNAIKEGGVGLSYDDNGKIEVDENGVKHEGYNTDYTITTGEQLFGKDGMRNELNYQAQNISSRGDVALSSKYSARKADERMIKGQGQSEKK